MILFVFLHLRTVFDCRWPRPETSAFARRIFLPWGTFVPILVFRRIFVFLVRTRRWQTNRQSDRRALARPVMIWGRPHNYQCCILCAFTLPRLCANLQASIKTWCCCWNIQVKVCNLSQGFQWMKSRYYLQYSDDADIIVYFAFWCCWLAGRKVICHQMKTCFSSA